MSSRSIFLTVFALLAAAAAVVFLAISIDTSLYAPGASHFEHHFGLQRALAARVPDRYEPDLAPRHVLRKIYSVIAFAVVGFFAAPLFARNGRIAACALLVTGFSLTIEIVQRLTISEEGNLSSIFDLACGALGGAFGALAWNGIILIVRGTRSRVP